MSLASHYFRDIAKQRWSEYRIEQGVLHGYIVTGTNSCPDFAVRVSAIASIYTKLVQGYAVTFIETEHGEKFLTYGSADRAIEEMKKANSESEATS